MDDASELTPREPAAAPRDSPGPGADAAGRSWLRWVAVAGLCLVIWGGLALVWPWWERHRALEIVREQFRWDDVEKVLKLKRYEDGGVPGARAELDSRTTRALRVLGARRLELLCCHGLTSLSVLGDIATLQEVSLTYCPGLTSAAGLPAGLRRIDLLDCPGLTSVAGLPTALQELHTWNCTGLTSVTGLPPGLQELSLSESPGLVSLSGQPPGVRGLILSGYTGLTRVEELPAALTSLRLNKCTSLESLGPLPVGLKKVDLRDTPKLPEAVKAEIRSLVKKNGGKVQE